MCFFEWLAIIKKLMIKGIVHRLCVLFDLGEGIQSFACPFGLMGWVVGWQLESAHRTCVSLCVCIQYDGIKDNVQQRATAADTRRGRGACRADGMPCWAEGTDPCTRHTRHRQERSRGAASSGTAWTSGHRCKNNKKIKKINVLFRILRKKDYCSSGLGVSSRLSINCPTSAGALIPSWPCNALEQAHTSATSAVLRFILQRGHCAGHLRPPLPDRKLRI